MVRANGLRADAVRHALVAKEFERAAALVELAAPSMFTGGQEATLSGWLKTLPDELAPPRPVLSVWVAWASLFGGELEAAEARLWDAEGWLDTPADTAEPC